MSAHRLRGQHGQLCGLFRPSLADFDGDGLPDIIESGFDEAFGTVSSVASCSLNCYSTVRWGQPSGNFSAPLSLGLSLLTDNVSSAGASPAIMDINGDGVADLVFRGLNNVAIIASGNREFTRSTGIFQCTDTRFQQVGDFNGDGRSDFLCASPTLANNKVYVATSGVGFTANLNVSTPGGLLLNETGNDLVSSPAVPGASYTLLDFNGDGRSDVLRTADDPTKNVLFRSNGDGTFTSSSAFGATFSAVQLSKSDGSADFISGDFLGVGSIQILRTVSNATTGSTVGTKNQLYVGAFSNPSDLPGVDQLVSVVSPTGLRTAITYASLTHQAGGRYTNDRNDPTNKAVYPKVDVTLAIPVVARLESDAGVGVSTLVTEYAYRGLKVALDGRGVLGFRQTLRQSTSANGQPLTTKTDFLLDEPYSGVTRRSETRRGPWGATTAQLLSSTTNTYCDRMSASNPADTATTGVGDVPTDAAPCTTPSKVRRPYLRRTVETGVDLDGSIMPTVTTINTYNNFGDPINIWTQSSATVAGSAGQLFTKNTANTFCTPDSTQCPNKVAGDSWILGRITRATVTNTVPNLLSSISAGAGNAANATATVGASQPALAFVNCSSTTPTNTPTAATLTCSLRNNGALGATSVAFAAAAGTTVVGPTGACAAGTVCGTVTVTSGAGAGTYSGTLTATPNAGAAASQAFSLVVRTPASLRFVCFGVSPTTTPATASLSCTLINDGLTPIDSMTYSSTVAGATLTGPTGSCAANAVCGTVVVTSGTAAATYSGVISVTPNTGTGATQSVNLVVRTPSALSFSGCVRTDSNYPNDAYFTCTLSNAGQTPVTSIGYSVTLYPMLTVAGPTSCAGGATCGTVTVTAPGTYYGDSTALYVGGVLSAIPNTGPTATVEVTVYVYGSPTGGGARRSSSLRPKELYASEQVETFQRPPTVALANASFSTSR
jgi:hypothetical protein